MKTQDIFIAHPKTAEEIKALKAFVQALKIKFEITKGKNDTYNPDFVSKIERSKADYKRGLGRKTSIDELNRLWK